MTKAPISLQDLRRRIYVKAKAEPTWRFWGLYVHICKMGTLQEAYQLAKNNNGAPGIDGVTFDAIEERGMESFLKQIQDELVQNTYQPMPVRKKEIPKDGGTKVRVLSTVRQGALYAYPKEKSRIDSLAVISGNIVRGGTPGVVKAPDRP